MTKSQIRPIGFDRPFVGENTEGLDYMMPASDPTRRAVKYIGSYVKFGLQGDPDAIGKVVAANSSEALLMPYVSVLPIPGQAPAVALITEGQPLSVNPAAIVRAEPVPEDYLEAYVLGFKSDLKGRVE